MQKRTLQSTAARIKETAAVIADNIAKRVATFQANANARAEAARAVVTGKATVATKLAAAAQWLWNAALAANPIALVVIAVAALTAGVILLARNMSSGAAETKRLNQELRALNAERNSLESFFDLQNRIADALGKSEIEKTATMRTQTEERIKLLEDELGVLRSGAKLTEEQRARQKEANEELIAALDDRIVLRLQEGRLREEAAEKEKKRAGRRSKKTGGGGTAIAGRAAKIIKRANSSI
jgi:hypothetical protein